MSTIRNCSCGKPRTKAWHLACADCWALIPKPLQDDVYRLFKAEQGSDDHIAAVRRCYEAIHAGRAENAHIAQEEAEESGDLEERLDAAFNVADLEAQRRRAAHALETEM